MVVQRHVVSILILPSRRGEKGGCKVLRWPLIRLRILELGHEGISALCDSIICILE